jgi:hypothetical protein
VAAPRIVGRIAAARRQLALTASGEGQRVTGDVTAPIITIRDPRTLEIRQFLPLPRARDEQYLYTLDAYFYFPRSFGISAESWSQADFYRDADIFMRLHAPGMELGELADLDNAQNPGAVLRRQLPLLLSDDAPRASSLAKLAQLYSAELADAAVGAVEKLRSAVTAAAARGETAGLEGTVQRTCADLLAALGSVRRLRAKIAAFRALEPPELPQALAFAEEYASAVIDQELSELPLLIEQLPGLRDGRATAARMRVLVSRTLAQINHRRLEQGFATPWGDAPEYFSYRIGLLKAELERALHIDTRQRASDPFIRNSAAMVAAGLAATWAVLAQVQFAGSDYTRDHQALFISIAVIAYVLKDRIKEWTRQVLSNRILHWDHDREIVGDAMGRVGFGAFSGRARERVRYVTEAQVPAEISDLRLAHRTVRGVATESEQILHYRRHLLFAAGPTPVPVGFGAQGLLRLSLDEIIRRLDDPVELVRFYDYKTGRFSGAEVPKVHHLNLVLMSTDQHKRVRTLSRVRVVVNQRGVVRLDPVTVKHRPLW